MTDIVERLRDYPEGALDEAGILWSKCNDAADEIERLRAGGCARDQRTTQWCAEAEALRSELAERARDEIQQIERLALVTAERDALLKTLRWLKRLLGPRH
jgi:hypothetical protein